MERSLFNPTLNRLVFFCLGPDLCAARSKRETISGRGNSFFTIPESIAEIKNYRKTIYKEGQYPWVGPASNTHKFMGLRLNRSLQRNEAI